MNLLKAQRQYLRDENKKASPVLVEVPRSEWPAAWVSDTARMKPIMAWRSRDFLVVLWPDKLPRLSINRTALIAPYKYKDGITWDEIQRLKFEAGFGPSWAVECYPPDSLVVNVANIRHIFLLPEPPAYGWHEKA